MEEDQHVKADSQSKHTRSGVLLVVSSPSGGGKGTLIRKAREIVPGLGYSVSYTTRQPRPGEIYGRDYYFVSAETFNTMLEREEFLESACVHGNLYGTAHAEVARELGSGRDIILEIDVQGAEKVRQRVHSVVSVFILPPSYDVLAARLSRRGSERPPDLELRLRNARAEVERYKEFDYVVINNEVERAATELASIVLAERIRRERQEAAAQRVLATFTQK